MNTSAPVISSLSLGLIFFVVLVLIVGIYKLHSLPGDIATERNHPQVEAITVCSILGLLVFPFWMAALIWAYAGVIGAPLAQHVEPPPDPISAHAEDDAGSEA
jgi:hypothetical protein